MPAEFGSQQKLGVVRLVKKIKRQRRLRILYFLSSPFEIENSIKYAMS
jgi:hypothetical protein